MLQEKRSCNLVQIHDEILERLLQCQSGANLFRQGVLSDCHSKSMAGRRMADPKFSAVNYWAVQRFLQHLRVGEASASVGGGQWSLGEDRTDQIRSQ